MISLPDRIRQLLAQFTDNRYTPIDTRKGVEFNLRCPFHKEGQEMHPSFYWNTSTGLFFCHACKISGGLSQFLKLIGMQREDIADLVKQTRTDPTDRRQTAFTRKKRGENILRESTIIPESLLGLFDVTPKALLDAGFSEELLAHYDIGYDIARKRITFPLRDVYGNLIGISGRADKKYMIPRYKVYTDELEELVPGYTINKRSLIWNIHPLWAEANSSCDPPQKVMILVEGFKAALYLIQLGYTRTAALLGSTMSDVQRFILSVIGGDVLLFLDNDSAGTIGLEKIYKELLTRSGCHPIRIYYPPDMDGAQPDALDPNLIKQLIGGLYDRQD